MQTRKSTQLLRATRRVMTTSNRTQTIITTATMGCLGIAMDSTTTTQHSLSVSLRMTHGIMDMVGGITTIHSSAAHTILPSTQDGIRIGIPRVSIIIRAMVTSRSHSAAAEATEQRELSAQRVAVVW